MFTILLQISAIIYLHPGAALKILAKRREEMVKVETKPDECCRCSSMNIAEVVYSEKEPEEIKCDCSKVYGGNKIQDFMPHDICMSCNTAYHENGKSYL